RQRTWWVRPPSGHEHQIRQTWAADDPPEVGSRGCVADGGKDEAPTDGEQDEAPTSQTEPASDPAGVRDRPSGAHRVLHVLVALLVVFGPPPVLMGVLGGGLCVC